MSELSDLLISPTYRTEDGQILSGATESAGALSKLTEFAGSLATIYGGIELSKAQADQLKYQYQLEAYRNQQQYPTWDGRALPDGSFAAAGFGGTPINGAGWFFLAAAGVAAYLLIRG